MQVIKPIFNALSRPQLLEGCLGANTQNSNESLNQLVWKVCPKVSGCGPLITQIAAHDAAMIFNDGQMSRLKVLRRLGIKPGANAVSAHFKAYLSRIKQSEKRFKNNTVEARTAKRRERLRKVMANKKKEGVVYGSGLLE
ncbi:hypothetical protein JTE90_009575 [Oedothorax gibbosus]|uniref:Uncharacterized protein n=1 Tax=Oedothorax gibbosus TaxID=931172 RepID=A0AAV6VJN9_9ARAC|nr:hypothetical protein JTE90_009575 [Oedothorax gibbosus]